MRLLDFLRGRVPEETPPEDKAEDNRRHKAVLAKAARVEVEKNRALREWNELEGSLRRHR